MYYKVQHYLPTEDGTYELAKVAEGVREDLQAVVHIVPITGEQDPQFEGFEPDWDYEENILTSDSDGFEPDHILKLYYQKERKAYIDFTWYEDTGFEHLEDWDDREGYIWEDGRQGGPYKINETVSFPDASSDEMKDYMEATGKTFVGWKLTNDESDKIYLSTESFEINDDNWKYAILHKGETEVSEPSEWYQYEFYPVWEYETESLTIEKEVTGKLGSRNTEFQFTLTATPPKDPNEQPLSETLEGEYNVTGNTDIKSLEFTNSEASFELKDGQKVVIEGLPVGWTYTVSEKTVKNYQTTVKLNGEEQSIADSENAAELSFALEKREGGNSVLYINNCTLEVPETGVHLPVAPWTMMLLMTAGMGAVYVLGRRRRQ